MWRTKWPKRYFSRRFRSMKIRNHYAVLLKYSGMVERTEGLIKKVARCFKPGRSCRDEKSRDTNGVRYPSGKVWMQIGSMHNTSIWCWKWRPDWPNKVSSFWVDENSPANRRHLWLMYWRKHCPPTMVCHAFWALATPTSWWVLQRTGYTSVNSCERQIAETRSAEGGLTWGRLINKARCTGKCQQWVSKFRALSTWQ